MDFPRETQAKTIDRQAVELVGLACFIRPAFPVLSSGEKMRCLETPPGFACGRQDVLVRSSGYCTFDVASNAPTCWPCCSQFMLGGSLLVNPKLDDNGTDVSYLVWSFWFAFGRLH